MSEFSICIGNYGAYNDGYLIDRWVDLPLSEQELNSVLHDMRNTAESLVGTPCEEFYVSDYDGYPFGISTGCVFNETTPIHELNMLAHVMEARPYETHVVNDVLNTGCDAPNSVRELANWIAQADELPYYAYDCPEFCDNQYEKIGYTYLATEPCYIAMAHNGLDAYFDVEQYGEVLAQSLYLGDDGYVDMACEFPDPDALTYDQLMQLERED